MLIIKNAIKPKKQFPARLHVLLAANGRDAVVIRRGPSHQVATFHWDRHNDRFKLGQWISARIYERRADLSPDGKYMIYFAMNARWESKTRGSWTAISRAPCLKAITLYAKGDCWQGGGLFLAKNKYWLNHHIYQDDILLESNEIQRDPDYFPEHYYNSECLGVYFPRLIRDGWTLIENKKINENEDLSIFEKPLPKGWYLRKYAHAGINQPMGKSCYWDEHEVIHKSGLIIKGSDWEWADLDHKDLVWAAQGCLFRAAITSNKKLGEAKLLHDFNDYKFEKIKASY